jgi:hypothetical protein
MVWVDETTNERGETHHHFHNSWFVRNFSRVSEVYLCSRLSEAIWEYQSLHQGSLPNDIRHASELQAIANSLLANADVNKQVIINMPQDLIECVCCWHISGLGD